MTQTYSRVHIRWMIQRDMPEVLAIEEATYDEPWGEEDFCRCLKQRNCIGMVAEICEKIVAFVLYELGREGIDILKIVVAPSYRRRGIGLQIVLRLAEKRKSHGIDGLRKNVRESNLIAQLFLKSAGFRAIEVRRSFFDEPSEDAFLFKFQQPESGVVR